MAKQDFCFTYYDGDAARDMAHMNRLERGCYTDLIISQRKFGHLSAAQIKKVLSKDYEECWPAIELVLKIDDAGKYFIEWLANSVEKMARHSKKQKENVGKRLDKPKSKVDEPKEDLGKPKSDLDDPLGNGDGNEQDLGKGGMGEIHEAAVLPKMFSIWKKENPNYHTSHDLDMAALRKIGVFITGRRGIEWLSEPDVKNLMSEWGKWCRHISGSHLKNKSLEEIAKFKTQEIANSLKNGTYQSNYSKARVNSKSAGAERTVNNLLQDLQEGIDGS